MDTSPLNEDQLQTAHVPTLTMEELKQIGEVIKLSVVFEDYLSDRVMQLKLDSVTDKHEQSPKMVKSVLKNRNPESPATSSTGEVVSGTADTVGSGGQGSSSSTGVENLYMPGQFSVADSMSVQVDTEAATKYAYSQPQGEMQFYREGPLISDDWTQHDALPRDMGSFSLLISKYPW